MLQNTSAPVRSTMHATSTESGWTIDLEGRPGVVVHPSIVGDSLVTTTEPYESVLRAGVTVTVRSAAVVQDNMMVGTVEATYQTPGGQEKVPGTFRSTRPP
jgi:hypothetical protein